MANHPNRLNAQTLVELEAQRLFDERNRLVKEIAITEQINENLREQIELLKAQIAITKETIAIKKRLNEIERSMS